MVINLMAIDVVYPWENAIFSKINGLVLLGKIYTGNQSDFPMKTMGFSGENFPVKTNPLIFENWRYPPWLGNLCPAWFPDFPAMLSCFIRRVDDQIGRDLGNPLRLGNLIGNIYIYTYIKYIYILCVLLFCAIKSKFSCKPTFFLAMENPPCLAC